MRVHAGTHIRTKINTVCSCYYYGQQPGTLCVWVSVHVTFMFVNDYCYVMVTPVRALLRHLCFCDCLSSLLPFLSFIMFHERLPPAHPGYRCACRSEMNVQL